MDLDSMKRQANTSSTSNLESSFESSYGATEHTGTSTETSEHAPSLGEVMSTYSGLDEYGQGNWPNKLKETEWDLKYPSDKEEPPAEWPVSGGYENPDSGVIEPSIEPLELEHDTFEYLPEKNKSDLEDEQSRVIPQKSKGDYEYPL